jgi:hypothetical protein
MNINIYRYKTLHLPLIQGWSKLVLAYSSKAQVKVKIKFSRVSLVHTVWKVFKYVNSNQINIFVDAVVKFEKANKFFEKMAVVILNAFAKNGRNLSKYNQLF